VDTDVLIVGAGPTGLMLANQLARHGVRALLIDRNAGPARETRALGVQARTLEIYSHLGIAERAVELGKRATGANLWAQGRPTARVPLGDIGRSLSPYPFLLILGQDDNERLLGEALATRGQTVQWSTELVGLSQETDRVVARLRQPDGSTREITAAWTAGCDGARSSVREMSGIAFVGAPYEHVFFVADTQVTGPMVRDELNVFLWRDGFHLFFPMRGADHWRIVGILPAALRGRDDVTLDDVVPSIRHEAPGVAVQACTWFSTYRIHHRRAERFRQGRWFLLGDAAHIHSPVGAQGMNTGLQDAYNLGWKLALVVSGRAGASLLDSYEAERIPVAERLLGTTDRLFSLAVSANWMVGFIRSKVFARMLALAMGVERIRTLGFRTISQIGIRYPRSPLSSTLPELPRSAPRAGDRFPWLRLRLSPNGPAEDLFQRLDDTRFTLVVVGQPAPPQGSGLQDLLATLEVPLDPANEAALSRVGIPRRAFYLVRPDGYVGLAGTSLVGAALMDYFSERLGIGVARA
jgi:2-polyprenyl-6-methoxyphenol hydroxylase-like FAD-dependent oxidoreductase